MTDIKTDLKMDLTNIYNSLAESIELVKLYMKELEPKTKPEIKKNLNSYFLINNTGCSKCNETNNFFKKYATNVIKDNKSIEIEVKNSRAIKLIRFNFNNSIYSQVQCFSPTITSLIVYYHSNPEIPYETRMFTPPIVLVAALEALLIQNKGSFGKSLPKIIKQFEVKE